MNLFFASMIKTLFFLSLLSVVLLFGLEKSDASEMTKFQTLDMSPYHLSSASDLVCNRAAKTGFRNRLPTTTVLEVFHKHGPCAHENDEKRTKLSFAQILDNDQLRVKSIQARVVDSINTNKLDPNKSSRDKRAKLPARSGGNYIVTIGLGTPERRLNLIFDTGSYLTWTQCQPCGRKHNCYPQKDPTFNPHNSTSYSNIHCKSKYCPHNDPKSFRCYNDVTCLYDVLYGDGSYSVGFLSKEKITIAPITDVFSDFLFGCGHNNSGLFSQSEDGILGLGINPLSFVYQTEKKYGKYFSYCLPSAINSRGFLAFGKNDDDAKMISTPLVPPPRNVQPIYYFIEITSISVGGTKLLISELVFKTSGAIIDSGTVITRLPPVAYNTLSKEFKKQMNKKYKSAAAYSILDTCFYISPNTNEIEVPTVSFTFKGNARVDLDASGTLWVVNSTYVCLALAGNTNSSDLSIFGNHQQRTFEVAYDVARKNLGFIRNPNCR